MAHYFFNRGVKWRTVLNATPRQIYSTERDPVHIAPEAGWAPGLVWSKQNAGNYIQQLEGNVEPPSAESIDNSYKILFVANYGEMNSQKFRLYIFLKLN
jgi:hypothetical protein